MAGKVRTVVGKPRPCFPIACESWERQVWTSPYAFPHASSRKLHMYVGNQTL